MRLSLYRKSACAVAGFFGALLLYSCASPGTPSGGPRDENPPRFVRANPPMGATDVSANRAVLFFDELINVRDAFSKVVISPTSSETPRVSASGHRIYIDFKDTLAANTTYTVDFGNAIEDNNEGNKLEGFAYTFSTGPEIDSLQISGMVLGARNLEPQKSMVVGVYPASAPDSAFKTLKLERIAKTDDRGRFVIRGLKHIPYRLFALADVNNDYRWDNPDEDIAFYDTEIIPSSAQTEVTDTIYDFKTGKIDTIVNRLKTRFLPNDILLNSFNINFKPQYLVSYERPDSNRVTFIFNAPSPSTPYFRLLSDRRAGNAWYLMERSVNNDSITLWITDPRILVSDTLRIATDFGSVERDKSVKQMSDTLRFISRPKKAPKEKKSKKEKADSVPQINFLPVTLTSGTSLNIRQPLTFEFETPVERITPGSFRISEMVDTVWVERGSYDPVLSDSLSLRKYHIDYPWKYGTKYRLNVDTLAVHDIYGRFSRPLQQDMEVKKEDQYFNLQFNITPVPPTGLAFVELLNSSDDVVLTTPVINGIAKFDDVPLGTYYARLVADANSNGKYDTGDYDARIQPEIVYYYPRAIKMTKHWDMDQPWDLNATSVDLQKPEAIKKNKPERRKGDNNNKEEEIEEEEIFDPTRNPFDPNDRSRRRSTVGSY